MNCDRATELLCARLAGELPADDAAALDAHLADCPACRATAEAFQAQDAALRQAFEPRRRAAAAVAERVVGRLRTATPPLAPPAPRRRVLPWLVPLLSAAAGFLLAVGIFRPWERPEVSPGTQPIVHEAKETLKLTVATGAVEAKPPGQDAWQAVASGGTVEVGCSVRTPGTTRCEFRTADGSEVRLNADTEVAFKGGRQLDLVKGQILATVAEARSPFAVSVDQATVTALGTQFDLWRRPDETRLAVLQGTTRVDGKSARDVVKTGEIARIVDGKVEEKVEVREPSDLVKATDWVHELLKLKSRDNPELQRRVDDLLAQIGDTKMGTLSEPDIRSLGDHCVLPLTRFVQSPRSRAEGQQAKRVAAARILADLAQPWSIPDLIKLLDDDDQDVRYYAAKGLERLTTKTFGCPPRDWRGGGGQIQKEARERWQAWWDQNKDRYAMPP